MSNGDDDGGFSPRSLGKKTGGRPSRPPGGRGRPPPIAPGKLAEDTTDEATTDFNKEETEETEETEEDDELPRRHDDTTRGFNKEETRVVRCSLFVVR